MLSRQLDLSSSEDRSFLAQQIGAPIRGSIEDFRRGLEIVGAKLTQDWRTILPGTPAGFLMLKVHSKGRVGVGVMSHLAPLACALTYLSTLSRFDDLIRKLNIVGHEKQSAFMEAVAAGQYMQAGYEVELEPMTHKNRSCDFRVKREGRWIYVECKKENLSESSYWQASEASAAQIADFLGRNLQIPPQICINVQLPKTRVSRFESRVLELLKSTPLGAVESELGQVEGAKVWTTRRGEEATPTPGLVCFGRAPVGTTSTRLADATSVRIFHQPFGSRELHKVRQSIREARLQLPPHEMGMILLDIFHPEALKPDIEMILNSKSFVNVIGIVLMGNGAWFLRNPLYSSTPTEFAIPGVIEQAPELRKA